MLAVLLFCAIFYSNSISEKKIEPTILNPYLIINNTKISLIVADTPAERTQGLSYQKKLDKNAGMLFIFPKKQILSFWMKDMNFPLDVIWIDDDKIIKIDKNLPPEGEKPEKNYSSGALTNYVLEVNAGFCDENNIKVGDKVKYILN